METCTYGLGEGNRKPAAVMSQGADYLSHLESAYEGALVIEFNHMGVSISRQHVYPLYYRGELASAYIADMVIEGKIILELKSVSLLTAVMQAQLINYLRLSGVQVGYLINFKNERVVWRRFVV